MDDIVRQAMAKWPHVPDCYGWLALDARGDWYLRDDQSQAAGPFPQSKGSLLRHDKLIDFIRRNYACDAQGQWFFQNGPQRVYVELDRAPWVWRVGTDGTVTSHTGHPAQVSSTLLDEAGLLYLDTDLGFGLVHTLDMIHAAEVVDAGRWVLEHVKAGELPQRFGFVQSPAARWEAAAGSIPRPAAGEAITC